MGAVLGCLSRQAASSAHQFRRGHIGVTNSRGSRGRPRRTRRFTAAARLGQRIAKRAAAASCPPKTWLWPARAVFHPWRARDALGQHPRSERARAYAGTGTKERPSVDEGPGRTEVPAGTAQLGIAPAPISESRRPDARARGGVPVVNSRPAGIRASGFSRPRARRRSGGRAASAGEPERSDRSCLRRGPGRGIAGCPRGRRKRSSTSGELLSPGVEKQPRDGLVPGRGAQTAA